MPVRALISKQRLDVIKAIDDEIDLFGDIWVNDAEGLDWFARNSGLATDLYYDVRIYLALGQLALHGWSQKDCFDAIKPESRGTENSLNVIIPASGDCVPCSDPSPAGVCLKHGPEEHMKCMITDSLKIAEFISLPGMAFWLGGHEERERSSPAWLEFGQALAARGVMRRLRTLLLRGCPGAIPRHDTAVYRVWPGKTPVSAVWDSHPRRVDESGHPRVHRHVHGSCPARV